MTKEQLDRLQPDKNGNVFINLETLKSIVDKGNEHKADVALIVSLIRKLLTQIGILTPEGEIKFKVSRLVRSLTGVLLNTGSMEKDFAYLEELGPLVMKHVETVVDTQ